MNVVFRSAPVTEPFTFESLGRNWEQDPVTRSGGYPFYHYLQTEQGSGKVETAAGTYTLRENEGLLIAPFIRHSYDKTDNVWTVKFATFTGTAERSIPQIMIVLPLMSIAIQLDINGSRGLLMFLYIGMQIPYTTTFLMTFFQNLSRTYEEAAAIDGCGSFRTLISILLPLCKPALVSVGLFNFIWGWNAFMDPLIYLSSVKKYTLSLALRMTLDLGSAASWNEIFAMSVLSILPPVLLFFAGQKYFIQGISSSGLKG